MTDTPDRDGDDSALAAEYVLHLMDPVMRAEFEERLGYSQTLRREVTMWEQYFAGMANAELTSVAPPRRVKTDLMTRLFPSQRRPSSFWEHAGIWRGVSLVAICVAVALGAQVVLTSGPQPLLVGEVAAEDGSLRLLAAYDSVDGTLRLSRTDVAAPEGRVLELWAAPPDGAPISLGLLDETGEGSVTLPPELRDITGSLHIAISEEPPGGSPTGAPTGPVRAAGDLTDL